MKASEVIAKLSELIEEWGDLDVVSRRERIISDAWYIDHVDALNGYHGFCIDDDLVLGISPTHRGRS